MSDQEQQQQTQPAQDQPQAQQKPDAAKGDVIATYDVKFVKRYTGETHYVQGGSSVDLVRHGETGEPETEYALVADVDGAQIAVATWNAGRLDTRVANEQARQQQQQQV